MYSTVGFPGFGIVLAASIFVSLNFVLLDLVLFLDVFITFDWFRILAFVGLLRYGGFCYFGFGFVDLCLLIRLLTLLLCVIADFEFG